MPLIGDWDGDGRASVGLYDHQTMTLDFLDPVDPTRSQLLLRHDRLVLERYWRGADAAQASNLKSVSKSMLSALFGIAIADGKIAGLDERVGRLLPSHFGAAPRNRIRVRDLLDMRAGLAWA